VSGKGAWRGDKRNIGEMAETTPQCWGTLSVGTQTTEGREHGKWTGLENRGARGTSVKWRRRHHNIEGLVCGDTDNRREMALKVGGTGT